MMSIMLMVSSLGVYLALDTMGHDPAWSLALAQKHCQNKDWIYIDTTPLYALARFTGSALGLSLSGYLSMDVFNTPSLPTKMSAMMSGVILGQIFHAVHANIPRDPMSQFYVCELILNAAFVITIVKTYQVLFSFNFCGDQNKKKVSY